MLNLELEYIYTIFSMRFESNESEKKKFLKNTLSVLCLYYFRLKIYGSVG